MKRTKANAMSPPSHTHTLRHTHILSALRSCSAQWPFLQLLPLQSPKMGQTHKGPPTACVCVCECVQCHCSCEGHINERKTANCVCVRGGGGAAKGPHYATPRRKLKLPGGGRGGRNASEMSETNETSDLCLLSILISHQFAAVWHP